MTMQDQDREAPQTGRIFLDPLTIYYYEVTSCDFEEHEGSGCLMPREVVKISTKTIRNNRELLEFWLRKDDWEYPIPLDLQMFMETAAMTGLYEDSGP